MTTVRQSDRADHRRLLDYLERSMRDLVEGGRDGLAMQDRYETFAHLTDRELARRGLSRADVGRVAVRGKR